MIPARRLHVDDQPCADAEHHHLQTPGAACARAPTATTTCARAAPAPAATDRGGRSSARLRVRVMPMPTMASALRASFSASRVDMREACTDLLGRLTREPIRDHAERDQHQCTERCRESEHGMHERDDQRDRAWPRRIEERQHAWPTENVAQLRDVAQRIGVALPAPLAASCQRAADRRRRELAIERAPAHASARARTVSTKYPRARNSSVIRPSMRASRRCCS